jgi:hypothetical protein
MSDNKESRYWSKKLVFELTVLFIAAVVGAIIILAKELISLDDPDFYKLLLSFLNLIVVLIFFRFSDQEFELEFSETNSRDEKKRKDKSKHKYWKLLNIDVKNLVDANGEPVNPLERAKRNEKRVNLLVEQLHQNVHFYAIFLILVYSLFLIDNETLFSKLGWRDEYNLVHPYLKIGEDIFNLLSALFIFLGFKVLYDKTLSEKNNKIKYKRGAGIFALGVIFAYFMFIAISHYPIKSYKDASISNVDKITKSIIEIRNLKQPQNLPSNENQKAERLNKLYAEENEKLDELKKLSFEYYDKNSFASIKSITASGDYNDEKLTSLKEAINKYIDSQDKSQNRIIEIFSNLFLLLIGVYNGLTMALLFGRYISMEERVRAINKIKYKNIFTILTIYILPIYALSQPLFGSFDISVFGNAKWFADGVFLFCLIGKIFFLYCTYWFMKERLMHYYLHLVLTSHGVPKDFYTCFDYKYKKIIDGQADTVDLVEEKKIKNKQKLLETKVDSSAVELPTNQSVSDEKVLNLWADRQESAQEIARKIRKGNQGTDD